jgi:hypothetical protein
MWATTKEAFVVGDRFHLHGRYNENQINGWLPAFVNATFVHRYMNRCVSSRTFMPAILLQNTYAFKITSLVVMGSRPVNRVERHVFRQKKLCCVEFQRDCGIFV